MIKTPILLNFRGYLNNPHLKKAGIKIEWTEESVQEYKKCTDDPIYFIETYMKIVHVDQGLIAFKLRGYQREMITAINGNRRVIMTMARQSGKSTALIGYILWFILFHENVTAGLLANKGETAREIFAKLRLAYMHLPLFIQQGIMYGGWNKGSIELENGSRAVAESTASDTVRGYTFNLLCIDETAHIEHWDEFSQSVIPTISSGQTTKMVQISTPKGLNHFYKTWMNAQPGAKDPNGFYPIMVHWSQVPGRDEKWKSEALKELNNDMDKFAQEYECEFMGSSGTLIAGWKLKELMQSYANPIYEKEGLYKYVDKEEKHQYAVTVDVSEGKGLDYSTFHVIDVTTMPYVQVCVYRSNLIGPHEFAQILYNTAKSYNNAAVLVEYESLGPQISDILYDTYDYENLLSTESAGSRGKKISTKGGTNIDRGIKMTVTVRATGCSLLKLLVESNQLIINDYNTIMEMATFSREEGKTKFEAEEGCHDDLVMALVVFSWLSDQNYFSEITNINTLSQLRDRNIKAIEDELVPFGFWSEPPPIPAHLQPHNKDVFHKWLMMDPDDEDYPKNF